MVVTDAFVGCSFQADVGEQSADIGKSGLRIRRMGHLTRTVHVDGCDLLRQLVALLDQQGGSVRGLLTKSGVNVNLLRSQLGDAIDRLPKLFDGFSDILRESVGAAGFLIDSDCRYTFSFGEGVNQKV